MNIPPILGLRTPAMPQGLLVLTRMSLACSVSVSVVVVVVVVVFFFSHNSLRISALVISVISDYSQQRLLCCWVSISGSGSGAFAKPKSRNGPAPLPWNLLSGCKAGLFFK